MIIETKYNIGDSVWFIDRTVHCQSIDEIKIEQTKDLNLGFPRKPIIWYRVFGEWWTENRLYATKEELIKSLL